MIPATNIARFNHLIGLARDCEKQASYCGWRMQEKLLKLSAAYREMAFIAMPTGPDPEALELTLLERNVLAEKLRRMTVENGCTPAEADTALQLLLRLEARL